MSYIQSNDATKLFQIISRVFLTPHTSGLNKFYYAQIYGFVGNDFTKSPSYLYNFTSTLYGIKFGDCGSFFSTSWMEGGWPSFSKTIFYLFIIIMFYNILLNICSSTFLYHLSFISFIYSLFPLFSVDLNTWFSTYNIKLLILTLFLHIIFSNILKYGHKSNS